MKRTGKLGEKASLRRPDLFREGDGRLPMARKSPQSLSSRKELSTFTSRPKRRFRYSSAGRLAACSAGHSHYLREIQRKTPRESASLHSQPSATSGEKSRIAPVGCVEFGRRRKEHDAKCFVKLQKPGQREYTMIRSCFNAARFTAFPCVLERRIDGTAIPRR
jgi:hypothetical protein